jgi:hypothetical protein
MIQSLPLSREWRQYRGGISENSAGKDRFEYGEQEEMPQIRDTLASSPERSGQTQCDNRKYMILARTSVGYGILKKSFKKSINISE